MSHIKRGFICLLINTGLLINPAWSCGVNSHLWITDSAICQLPEGSRLKAFYSNQTHVDLTRLGSSFPDSGYAINHESMFSLGAPGTKFVRNRFLRTFTERVKRSRRRNNACILLACGIKLL